jgi:hypothetical protein
LPGIAIDLTSAVERRPLAGAAEAVSGAELESVQLRDGQRLVVKHLPADGDFMTHVTTGAARLRTLWTSGALERIGGVVDHTILDVRQIGGRDVVIMRDATDDLVQAGASVSRDTSRRLLAGLAQMHESLRDVPLDDPCPLEGRYAMASPDLHATYRGPGAHPMADTIVRGWELFEEHVDRDVAEAVAMVHREPKTLGDRLRRFPATLLHGDPKLANLGLVGGRLVAIDWGELTGSGPREVDVAWYAQKGSTWIGCTPEDVFSDYDAASSEPLDRQALDLACVGALAQMGFRLAVAAYASSPEPAPQALGELEWWTRRVRAALDRIGTI